MSDNKPGLLTRLLKSASAPTSGKSEGMANTKEERSVSLEIAREPVPAREDLPTRSLLSRDLARPQSPVSTETASIKIPQGRKGSV